MAASGEFWFVRSFTGGWVGDGDPGPPVPVQPAITANPTIKAKRIRVCIALDMRAPEYSHIIKVIRCFKYWNVELTVTDTYQEI